MRTLSTAAFMVCMATAAHAMECTFTTECFDGEACAETDLEMTVAHNDHGLPTLETISETLHVTAIAGDGKTHSTLTATGEGAIHMLTRSTGGDARYTVHLTEGPIVISYLGTCKVGEE